jgi:hypothetical protein
MGNKQSLESAFDTANDVYHEIKRKQQEQQQGGQQSQGQYPGSYSHPQGQYLQPSHGAPYQQQPHQQHQNNHQGYQNNHQEYTRLRNLAHQEALARNDCYQRSQAAYNGGDGAEG